MPDFNEVLDKVPDRKRYYSVDELHESSAKLVNECPEGELIELGRSTEGEMIECVKIGVGRYNALIHGFPNCEEPFGGNLLDYLSWALAGDEELREELDYTWYLVKCSDPDGARRNEGFHGGPHTPMNFSLNYYRTPNRLTPESCFPYRYGPLDLDDPVPETSALMTLLDSVPFHFMSSLHMMKWGGITYEVPEPCPELYPPLWDVTRRFDVFPRKRPGTTIAPAVQLAAYMTPARSWVEQWARGNTNIEPIRGCYIYEYGLMRNPKLFMMIPECCLWYDPRMWNDEPSDTTVGDALRRARQTTDKHNRFLLEAWQESEPHLKERTPFRAMMEEWMEPIARRYTNVSNPPFTFDEKTHARRATVAEKIGIMGREDLYRMFYVGGMIRTLDAELESGGGGGLVAIRENLEGRLQAYDDHLHEEYTIMAHPIRNLVGMSLGSILHSAMYVKSKQLWY
ncbi:MAG: hypothetical protein JSV27_03045 [Candidatus Bathyarchaeota archaeon]|nr:MAG: hypothetical protein JSV27_03045 [Candidatus Bathyarchaeota archaeon]